MEILNCINGSGILVKTKYFAELYKCYPNSLNLTFNKDDIRCDICSITDIIIKNIFPNASQIIRSINKFSAIDNSERATDIFSLDFRTSSGGSTITIVEDEHIFVIDCDSLYCLYINDNPDKLETWMKDIWNSLPKISSSPKEAIVNLVGYSDGDYYTLESKIKSVNVNIEENYNDDFLSVHKDIVEFINSRESGLILLHGTQGTGKTNYIRHLCCNYPSDYIIVPTSLTNKLGDPDFVNFMISNTNSVFILEDCEQILMDRGINVFNGAISNILNMSDGLLSDIMNIKFICTFNADITTIDSALLRKGRCYAKYQFTELCEEKVKLLNDKYNLGIQDIKPMTLANIYNTDKTEYGDKKKVNKIGF